MYIPKSKYESLETAGDELQTKDKVEYFGNYIKTYQGKFYEGVSPQESGKELFPLEKVVEGPTTLPSLENEYPQPTEKDYQYGYFWRYLIKDNRDGKVYEVSHKTFHNYPEVAYLTRASIKWQLIGPVQDRTINGYKFPGTATRNSWEIDSLEAGIKGITLNLKASEFVK